MDIKRETGYRKCKIAQEHLHSHLVSLGIKSFLQIDLIYIPWCSYNFYKLRLEQPPLNSATVPFQLSCSGMQCHGISGWGQFIV